MWNIDSFETELSQYGFDALRLQYHDIQYDTMYRAITTLRHAYLGSGFDIYCDLSTVVLVMIWTMAEVLL